MTEQDPTRPSAFDRAAYERFKLPRRLGETIAAWDGPAFVAASDAGHMRPDDYVLGIVVVGCARAYPIWIIDNYHVVNDAVEDRPFIVTSCERCGSGSAFFAEPPGGPSRPPLFRAGGLLNAVLMMSDMRSGSHWLHYEGRGLDRRAAGLRLPWIPTYHTEWADWRALHPDTEVWIPPDDPGHPDARHGHGREEFFARPGMEPALLETMAAPYDTSYPENEMVLGVGDEERSAAYPWREVQREGGVVHDEAAEGRIVVLAGPGADGITMSAFVASTGERPITLARRDGAFTDLETGSRWTIEGVAVEGDLHGTRLPPVRSFYVRWHAWVYWHASTRLFRSDRTLPRYGEPGTPADGTHLDPFLAALTARGHEVRIEGPVPSQRRPRRSSSSLALRIDDDRVIAHAFLDEASARDHESLRGAWSALPLRARVLESRVRRMGSLVLESAPEDRYVDPAQIVPVPWSETRWAAVLDGPELDELRTELGDESGDEPEPAEAGFADVLQAIRSAGHEIVDAAFLPAGQLRVGALDAVAMILDGDRMLLYLFADERGAHEYASGEPHARAYGRFVLRSTPDTMYVHQFYEILYAGDERIAWSRLLEDSGFEATMLAATGPGGQATPHQARDAVADVV